MTGAGRSFRGEGGTAVYATCLIAGSLLVAAYRVLAYRHPPEELTMLARVWPTLFPMILVLWAAEDSQRYPTIYRPFDWKFFAFIFWIPYMPYYLWKTRGMRGVALAFGLFFLAVLGDLAVLTATFWPHRP